MISLQNSKGHGFQFSEQQINDKIKEMKLPLAAINIESGLLPLRYAIRTGRLDVVRTLLKNGASPVMRDRDGLILNEALQNSKYGSLHLLTELLQYCDFSEIEEVRKECKPVKFSMKYFLDRASKHHLPLTKLRMLGLPYLNMLKFRIVGQPFAIEEVC